MHGPIAFFMVDEGIDTLFVKYPLMEQAVVTGHGFSMFGKKTLISGIVA